MSNEELVSEIRGGRSVAENMERLYTNNLPLIKKIIRPYIVYEDESDLLQESYFGLLSAVQHYETDKHVLFATYMPYRILQSVQRYLEKCGSMVRIPNHTRQKITRYKKTVQELEQELGRTPTDNEIADRMCISADLLPELKMQMQGVASLDAPLTDDNSLTLSDTLQADFNVENEVLDKVYGEYSNNELWGIVERFTSVKENEIIKNVFVDQKTMSQIARETGVSLDRIRQIKEKGLRRLRIGKAKRELLEKFDVAESKMFRGTLKNFREHNYSSVVERLVLQRTEAEKCYKRRLAEIETLHQ